MAERTLDEQCARAMGWRNYVERQFLVGARTVTTGPLYDDSPPRYSTDPALLDAKLEWLDQNRVGVIRMDRSGLNRRCRVACVIGDEKLRAAANVDVTGATIHEATARLVVAVAERLKEKP